MPAFARRQEEPNGGLEVSNVINPNDHGAYVTIALALCLTCSFLFYGFRLTTRWPLGQLFLWDDVVCTIATLLGLAQAIMISRAIHYGFGQHEYNLPPSSLSTIFKRYWISNILYILALCFGRMSDSMLIYRLTRTRKHVVAALSVTALIALWGLACVSLIGASCNDFTDPSAYHSCMRTSNPRWIGIAVSGFVMEVLLLSLPVYLIWGLRTSHSTKSIVIMAFWLRTPVTVIGALRLDALVRALGSQDLTFALVRTEVYTQVELHLCIVCATVPCMRPFLRAFNTGYLATMPHQMGPHKSSYIKESKVGSALKSLTSGGSKDPAEGRGTDAVPLGRLRPDLGDTVNLIECRRPSTVPETDGLGVQQSDQILVRKTVKVSIE